MTALTKAEQETVSELISMGFDDVDVKRAVRHRGTDLQATIDAILSGDLGPPLDQALPPPPPVPASAVIPSAPTTSTTTTEDESEVLPPPYGPTNETNSAAFGPSTYTESKSTAIVPYHPPVRSKWSPDIDLTVDDVPSSTGGLDPKQLASALEQSTQTHLTSPAMTDHDEDSDYQRAIAMSMQDVVVGPPTQQQQQQPSSTESVPIGAQVGDDDAELNKAMALSLGDLRGHDDPEGANGPSRIRPEDRIKNDDGPVVVRSTSALLSILSALLQCLYAVPTWRKAVIEFRPNQFDLGCSTGLNGIWSGEEGGPGLEGSTRAKGDRVWHIIALQRLFALMSETKRSFLHITEATRPIDPKGQLLDPTFHPPASLDMVIVMLVETLHNYSILNAKSLPEEEATKRVREDARRFCLSGKTFNNNPVSLAAPIAEPPLHDLGETLCTIHLRFPSSPPAPTLYDLIDAHLNDIAPSSPTTQSSTPPSLRPTSLNLITQFPQSLILRLDRIETEVNSLDHFGEGVGKRSRSPVRFEERLWLDRYDASRRVKVATQRDVLCDLGSELGELERRRSRLGRTAKGADAIEVVEEAKVYLDKVGDKTDDRKLRLRQAYERIGEVLKSKIEETDEAIKEMKRRIEGAFEGDEWRKRGAYELRAILMRNGLNGRGSAWAVVKEGEKWWRIKDLEKEEITLEQALSDPSGLVMDAGATFLFYENASLINSSDAASWPPKIPPLLRHLILEDNHAFASELPAEIVSAWSPPLESLPSTPPEAEEEPWIDNASPVASPAMDSSPLSPPLTTGAGTEEVIEFLPPALGDPTPSSPVAVDLPVDELDDPTSQQQQDVSMDEPSTTPFETPVTSTSMSQEVEGDGAQMVVDEETMRLRGGMADDDVEMGRGEEEGEDYSDDEYDEDEVELGLLQPMPKDGKVWDVDFAVGKVGGKPVWLDPRSTLEPKQVECGNCGKSMAMLLQVNSPDDTRAHAAARSLYVFACKSKDCLAKDVSKATKVWRVQLPSPNEFFPHTDETQKLRKELEETLDATTALSTAPSSHPSPWPEWDIAAEPEPYEESYLESDREPTEGALEDAEVPDTQSGVDKAFLNFQERVERVPEQVLRFYRLPGVEDPQPLWANTHRILSDDVPKCGLCGSRRQVEFQVLSTLLSFFKDDNLSFDSLLVYTCVDNCEIPKREGGKTGWAEEVLIGQEFDQQGVRFGQGPA